MIKILCYGDSNTYGHLPLDGSRMPEPWPAVLRKLIPGCEIIEEGRCGRTTHLYENEDAPDQDGTYRFKQLIAEGTAADLLIIMLGTNDILNGIGLTAEESTESLRGYIHSWRETFGEDKRILIISPIHVSSAFSEHPYFSTVYPKNSVELSKRFAPLYAKLARDEGVSYLDAAVYAEASDKDGIHMEPEVHEKLAAAVAKEVKSILNI